MNREKLEDAANQGIISKAQVESLLSFWAAEAEPVGTGNAEEQLRFVRSFGDIFITLGIIFVAVAGAQVEMSAMFNFIPVFILIATTEWLVRVRRLALPGIALLVSILYFAGEIIGPENALQVFAATTVLASIFYWRYKMPFTLVAIAYGALGFITVLLGNAGFDLENFPTIVTSYGLIIFAVAMWFDSQDTKRENRLSDAAFWLHLPAAPMIVHGVMISLLGVSSSEFFIIFFLTAFFLLALYVDRRAILVSSTGYAIYVMVQFGSSNSFNIENLTLVILASFGACIIVFGVYWYNIRNFIFFKVRDAKLSKYVPAIENNNK